MSNVYVKALMHCALLLAHAHAEATRALKSRNVILKKTYNDRATEFTKEADKISRHVFGRGAVSLL